MTMNLSVRLSASLLAWTLVGMTAQAQSPSTPAPAAPASAAASPLPGSTTGAGARAVGNAMPILEGSTPKQRGLLTYSRARYRTVSSYTDQTDRRLITSGSVSMYYQPIHLREYEIDLYADYYGWSRPRAGTAGLATPAASSPMMQAFPQVGTKLPGPDGQAFRVKRP
jgi:hypothetical protein